MTLRPLPTLSLSLLLAAACSKPAEPPPPAAPAAANPEVEAAASCRVSAAIVPAELGRGGKATLGVEIAMTRPDVHVQKEFPLKLSLAPSAGLAVPKRSLGHADSVDPEAKGRRWQVPVVANAGGTQRVEVALRFALCKETEPMWCVTRNETVQASVEVR